MWLSKLYLLSLHYNISYGMFVECYMYVDTFKQEDQLIEQTKDKLSYVWCKGNMFFGTTDWCLDSDHLYSEEILDVYA